MIRIAACISLLFILTSCDKKKTPYEPVKLAKIFFSINEKLFNIDADGSHLGLVYTGFDIAPSADGLLAAYTVYIDSIKQRGIAIYNIATKQITILSYIPGSNNYRPVFSPNGKKILFSHYNDTSAVWEVAIVDIDGHGYRVLVSQKQQHFSGFFSPTWLSDQSGFLCHTLDTVYQFDLNGKLVIQYPSASLVDVNKYGISSSTVFYKDVQKNCLYFEAGSDMEETDEILPYGIFTYDLSTKTTKLISPDSLHAFSPMWNAASGRFYFLGYGKSDFYRLPPPPPGAEYDSDFGAHLNLFSVKEDGSDLKKVVSYKELERFD